MSPSSSAWYGASTLVGYVIINRTRGRRHHRETHARPGNIIRITLRLRRPIAREATLALRVQSLNHLKKAFDVRLLNAFTSGGRLSESRVGSCCTGQKLFTGEMQCS